MPFICKAVIPVADSITDTCKEMEDCNHIFTAIHLTCILSPGNYVEMTANNYLVIFLLSKMSCKQVYRGPLTPRTLR